MCYTETRWLTVRQFIINNSTLLEVLDYFTTHDFYLVWTIQYQESVTQAILILQTCIIRVARVEYMYKSAEILTGGLTMKHGAPSTQRTLFDLPGATPKRSRLNLENSCSTANGDDHGSAIQSNLTSANVDLSTSMDQERVYSSSTGQETESDACLTSVDLETGSSTSEGTTIATSPNDIAIVSQFVPC